MDLCFNPRPRRGAGATRTDPDAGNLPRADAETGRGLVTDVCLKRKVRNFVGLVKGEQPPFEIYVKEKAVLNAQHRRAYLELKLEPESKKLPKNVEDAKKLTSWMCQNFYDIRTFGAVMSNEVNCGQVRGPVQMTFSRSIDPIVTLEHSITVCAARKEDKPIEEQIGIQGRKFTVPYGLYVAHGFVSSFLAKQTGFDEGDLELLWQALAQMFEHDRSAARGEMTTRGLYVFKHDSELGNAPAHNLFDLIQVKKNSDEPARDFADYTVSVKEAAIPAGVSLQRKVG
ncbi:MAG TPA: type I-C CRISPR-associated protein Cas7/Csd2 [Gallionella sp.]|nr:type I-C CRISPR-associated protein Cas7/Csd2 [Gallionella sp.]